MRNRLIVGLFAAAVMAAVVVVFQRPAAETRIEDITYDRLMRDYTIARRYTLFSEQLPAAKKAELMGIHYERCLAALGSTLTPEQVAVIHDAQAAVSPGAYMEPPEPAASAKMDAVERRAQTAFSPEQGVQIFTLWSECKPQ